MTDTTTNEAAPAPMPPMAPKIRMDKSRAYAEVHGDRPPGDRHSGVHFYQDGLPHDAQGFLILDHSDYEGTDPEAVKRRATAEKKVRKFLAQSEKKRAAAVAEGGPDYPRGVEAIEAGDEDEENEDDAAEPINLSAWARGEQQVEWQEITQEIARRYKKRIASIADAIPFLVKEGVCPPDQIAKKFKKYLD